MAGASAGRKGTPPGLKLINGQGTRKDGQKTDSGGRIVKPTPSFRRALPQKPFELEGDASDLWDLIVQEMGRVELLKPIDAASLEILCETYARWKDAVRKRRQFGAISKNSQGVVTAPWVGIEERASKDFRSWCAEYGLTPAAENKLGESSGGTDDEGNPFDW